MMSTASTTKSAATEKPPSQYSRLQKLLNFRFFDKTPQSTEPSESSSDDFIDIVLEADFTANGKVRNIR